MTFTTHIPTTHTFVIWVSFYFVFQHAFCFAFWLFLLLFVVWFFLGLFGGGSFGFGRMAGSFSLKAHLPWFFALLLRARLHQPYLYSTSLPFHGKTLVSLHFICFSMQHKTRLVRAFCHASVLGVALLPYARAHALLPAAARGTHSWQHHSLFCVWFIPVIISPGSDSL